MMKKLLLLVFCVALTSCSGLRSASEEDISRLVFFGRIFAEETYKYNEYPLDETEIVIVENQYNIIWPRFTRIYYWPLTNEWKTDLDSLNEPMGVKIQIFQGGNMIQTIEQTDYVVQIEDDQSIHLFFGTQALEAYARFNEEFEGYLKALQLYREQYAQYQSVISAAFTKAQTTGIPVAPETLPAAPISPEQFRKMSSKPALGFPVFLPAGDYQVKLIDEKGLLIQGGERKMRVIKPIQTGVSYKITPEDRWTDPDYSYDVKAPVYLDSDETIYLTPEITRQYFKRDWQGIQSPQKQVLSGDATVWVPVTEKLNDPLLVTNQKDSVSLKQYRVNQNPGAALGYEITLKSEEDSRSPDLVAYRIQARDFSDSNLQIGIRDSNEILDGSIRNIIFVRSSNNLALILILSMIPSGIYILLIRDKWKKKFLGKDIEGDIQ